MKKYKNLVWDWNGTLLDDITAGVETLNDMLEKRGLQNFLWKNTRMFSVFR